MDYKTGGALVGTEKERLKSTSYCVFLHPNSCGRQYFHTYKITASETWRHSDKSLAEGLAEGLAQSFVLGLAQGHGSQILKTGEQMESCVNHVIDTARPRASPSSRDQLTSVTIKVVPGSADQWDNKSCDCDKFSGT
ncbi:hypothetical protein BgiMline_022272 [Biomphalaria glabrata]|nr:hypothetical protein BgiMline_010154 [Biomphalaria glabrata]